MTYFKKLNEEATKLQKLQGRKPKKVKVMKFEEVIKSVYVLPRTEAIKRAANSLRNKKKNVIKSSISPTSTIIKKKKTK